MKRSIYGYQNSERKISVWKEHPVKSFDIRCALKILVEIPEELNPYETEIGTCINYNGGPMSLDEVLFADKSGNPRIHFPDMNGKDKTRALKIISEEG